MPDPRLVPSLRWTSVAWLALVLALVITLFGATLYLRVRKALFTRVDAALVDRAHILAASLENDLFTGWEFALDDNYLELVAAGGWFEVTANKGRFVRRAGAWPAHEAPTQPGITDFGDAREYVLHGEKDVRVRVGQSTAAERAELRRVLSFTIVAGLAVLLLASLGGWWLVTRTLLPIRRMSIAAGGISERDLSQRIDVAGVPVELRDLAETLNATFSRLESAFTRQARFTADASHELRTPLAVMRAQAELALRRDRTSEEYRAGFEACLRSTKRMSHVVEQLLALARADAGEIAMTRTVVAFDAVVREALDDVRAAAADAGIGIASDLTPALLVYGDASLLYEVVANVATNAIRYNKPGGHVRIKLERSGNQCVLHVEDDGEGIPEEALEHVFERFFRVDPARSRERGGSGLGLAITRWIVDAHGGSITVESTVGAGSVFTVRLPLADTAILNDGGAFMLASGRVADTQEGLAASRTTKPESSS